MTRRHHNPMSSYARGWFKTRENYGGVLGKFYLFRDGSLLHIGALLVSGAKMAGRACLGRKYKSILNGWRSKVEGN